MDEKEISSWAQFTRLAEDLDVGAAGTVSYIFRGHADASWSLEPTLLRKFHQIDLPDNQALQTEKMALKEFKSQAHLYLAPNVLSTTTDTISWWTVMQQHGAPTRLLDWCASIYVAAYFAVTEHPTVPGAIWLVHGDTVNQGMAETYEETGTPKTEAEIQKRFLKPDAPLKLLLMERQNKTDRMIAQQGLFTICENVLGDHGEILQEIVPDSSTQILLRKIIIPATLKATFLRKLRTMNITARSLFPGLDGLARSTDEFIQAMAK